MSHPAALIDLIRRDLEREYPSTEHRYVIEQAIAGTRMFPDIQIWRDQQLLCAVEIGYTRPEKLTAYRTTLKVPDVRWYDKQGTLHGDVNERVVRVLVETVLQAPSTAWIYQVHDAVDCLNKDCCECGVDDEAQEHDDDCMEYRPVDVLTTVVTDRVRAFYPSFCDKCGSTWFADPEDDALVLGTALQECSPQEFGRLYGAARKVTWADACELIGQDYDGLQLDYPNGHLLRLEDEAALARQLSSLRTEMRMERAS